MPILFSHSVTLFLRPPISANFCYIQTLYAQHFDDQRKTWLSPEQRAGKINSYFLGAAILIIVLGATYKDGENIVVLLCNSIIPSHLSSYSPSLFLATCGNLVSGIRIKPRPQSEVWGPNHQTTREFPSSYSFSALNLEIILGRFS